MLANGKIELSSVIQREVANLMFRGVGSATGRDRVARLFHCQWVTSLYLGEDQVNVERTSRDMRACKRTGRLGGCGVN